MLIRDSTVLLLTGLIASLTGATLVWAITQSEIAALAALVGYSGGSVIVITPTVIFWMKGK